MSWCYTFGDERVLGFPNQPYNRVKKITPKLSFFSYLALTRGEGKRLLHMKNLFQIFPEKKQPQNRSFTLSSKTWQKGHKIELSWLPFSVRLHATETRFNNNLQAEQFI